MGGRAPASACSRRRAPLLEGAGAEVLVSQGEQIEGHERGRRLLGELPDARGRGVDAVEQGVEVEPPRSGDDHLAVHHAARRERRLEWLDQLGEVAGQRLLVPAAQLDRVAVAEDDGPEAVPLRLVR